MKIFTPIKRISLKVGRYFYSNLPFKGINAPIFILGCGRSGTTILGRILDQHHTIVCLNEPRELWFSAYPETDIWTSKALIRHGKLCLTEEDIVPVKSNKIRRLFNLERYLSGKSILIEKLPINSFRLRFIQAIFPNAKFIHIYRNGLEVARSISKISEIQPWFQEDGYKWKALVTYASEQAHTRHLPELCQDNYQKGLLEWRLSTEAVLNFLSLQPTDRFIEVSYRQLVEAPGTTVEQILSFIGVEIDGGITEFLSHHVKRQSSCLDETTISKADIQIGGNLLLQSINNPGGLLKKDSGST